MWASVNEARAAASNVVAVAPRAPAGCAPRYWRGPFHPHLGGRFRYRDAWAAFAGAGLSFLIRPARRCLTRCFSRRWRRTGWRKKREICQVLSGFESIRFGGRPAVWPGALHSPGAGRPGAKNAKFCQGLIRLADLPGAKDLFFVRVAASRSVGELRFVVVAIILLAKNTLFYKAGVGVYLCGWRRPVADAQR